ncbi:MAG TPA: RIP metalloprotease RseP [Candidatus Saccharimonadaceae bacterium]|jgi:regulator of sigma E protease|nr:RIP metalloprotease RseP [Candidatus Saccharimonadaceae bacterium]
MGNVLPSIVHVLAGIGPGIGLLGIVIFVHELGHFLAAKARGVTVLRFSLGFGPALLAVHRGGTEYRLSWVPLGGYVQMAGDSPGEDGSMPATPKEYLSHPWQGRMLIAVAGPLANLITAFLVVVVVGMTGTSYSDAPNILGAVSDTSLAYQAGLREGDRIVTVDGQRTSSWLRIFLAAGKRTGQPLDLGVERGATPISVHVPGALREPVMSSIHRPDDPPVVGAVVTGMPAYKAGLREGDRILAVNGRPIRVWNDLPQSLKGQVDKAVTLRVERGGQDFDVSVTPINPEGGAGDPPRIGIEAPRHEVYIDRHTFLESVDIGFHETIALVGSVYGGMWLTVSRPLYYREYLGGPLFIAQAASEQARRGLDSYLQFLALINVAIMAFNLLPLPVLDGGHIVLALLQAVRRRSLSARAYLQFQRVGLVVLGTLFILILANDPWRWIQRQRALDRAPHPAPREKTVAPSPP